MEEPLVQRVESIPLPTRYGAFTMTVFSSADGKEHLALSVGTIDDGEPVLVRLHSECLTGDALGSLRCDCRDQLKTALRTIAQMEPGIVAPRLGVGH